MRYFVQRFIQFLIVFFLVTFGVMVLLRLGLNKPGDPARTLLGGAPSQEQIDTTTERYHLDSNYLVQYWYWLTSMLRGDFGFSVQNSLPVRELIAVADHDDGAARDIRRRVRGADRRAVRRVRRVSA